MTSDVPTPHRHLAAAAVMALLGVVIAPATATPSPQQVRFDPPAPGERWLVRLELRMLPTVESRVDGRKRSLHVWSTASREEFLIRDESRVWLVDVRQGRLFQMADGVRERLAREFELIFPYPVPVRERDADGPSEAIEIRDPRVEVGTAYLPTATALGDAKRMQVGDTVYMPNVELREFLEVYRVAFTVGGRVVEVFLQPTEVS